MNLRDKWLRLLSEQYENRKGDISIEAISPELLKECEFWCDYNSLYGMSIADIEEMVSIILQNLKKEYNGTEEKIPFRIFVKEKLEQDGLPFLSEYIQEIWESYIAEQAQRKKIILSF